MITKTYHMTTTDIICMVRGPQTKWALKLGPMARSMTPTLYLKLGPRPARSGAWPKAHWAYNPDPDTSVHNLGPAQSSTSRTGA